MTVSLMFVSALLQTCVAATEKVPLNFWGKFLADLLWRLLSVTLLLKDELYSQ